MRAPVSVVIPTLNAMAGIRPVLAALGEGVAAGLIREVIFADGGSGDEVRTVADDCGAVVVTSPPGRGGQLRAGGAEAGGDWLLFLHADSVLDTGWADALEQHMQRYPDAAACFRLRYREAGLPGRMVAGWANIRTRWFGLPYGDQGLLVSQKLYDTIGGYPDIVLMEDVVIARRLGRRRIRVLDCYATTSAERYQRDGWLRRGARNLLCLTLYFFGVSPEKIATLYRRSAGVTA